LADESDFAEELALLDDETIADNAPLTDEIKTGDAVYHNNRLYHVDSIDDSNVYLIDPSVEIPVKMHLFRREFDEILTRDERNAHLLPTPQDTQPEPQTVSATETNSQEQPRYSVAPLTVVEQISSNPRIASLLGKNESATPYGIFDNQSERYIKTSDERYMTFPTEAEATAFIESLEAQLAYLHELNGAVSSIYGQGRPLPQFATLEAVEAELDRKAGLMRDNPNYEKITEAIGHWKNWRTMSHLDGISADIFCNMLCEASDEKAVDWLSGVDWDNWRTSLGFIVFTDFSKPPPQVKQQLASNFRITDDQLGEGGAKSKFRNNLNAIHALKDIEFDKRSATPEEQETLSRYVGWGGLPQAFDPDNKQWTNEYLELNATLAPEEFEMARASTLNAHYTSPIVIKAMYEAIERMGFSSGNILEPSCGVGNFFGLLTGCLLTRRMVSKICSCIRRCVMSRGFQRRKRQNPAIYL